MIRINLYEMLQQRGWTQRQLSQEACIRESTISEMCNNVTRRLGVENLDNICRALNCKIEHILEYIPD